MYARALRYEDAPESQREKLIPMTMLQYGEWEDNTRQARREYLDGKITAVEFLRRIDTTRELSSYDTVKQELPPEETVWQKRVAADLDFAPERDYPQSFMELDLREATDDPTWQYFTGEDLIRQEQKGHRSLRDEYGRKPEKLDGN